MTEYTCFNPLGARTVCGICLATEDNITALTSGQITALQSLVPEMPADISACIYCCCLVAKFSRFRAQCLMANVLLQNSNNSVPQAAVLRGTSQLRPFHNLTRTLTAVESFEGCVEDALKSEALSDGDGEENTLGDENGDGDGDDDDDDDDIPLAMLNKDVEDEDKRKLSPEITIGIPLPVKSEPSDECEKVESPPKVKKTKKRDKKKKKVEDKNNDGKNFDVKISNRMVLETDQYVVIKLTKDEVRKEISDRLTSEEYMRAPYKCSQCAKGFNFEDVLRAHMERHSMEFGPLQCDICQQHCASARSLRGHYKNHTSRYKCKICGDIRNSRQILLEHYMQKHTGEPVLYTCTHCPFKTDKRTVMQRHEKTHCSKSLPCEMCGQTFKSIQGLRVHTRRHDRASLSQCPHCPRRFVLPAVLKRHVKAVHVDGEYYCVECDVRFKSPENMKSHFERAKVHRNESSYKHKCPECPSSFVTRSVLSVHLCRAHGRAAPHACAACGREYGSRESLRAHRRRAHEGLRPPRNYTCHTCQRAFGQRSTLTSHMSVHTGERAFPCPVCDKRFAQASTRDKHRALLHDKQGNTARKEANETPVGQKKSEEIL